MPLHSFSTVSCADCSDCEDLFNWQGDYRGMICRQDGEYRAKPEFGNITELSCHSIWELEGVYDGQDDSY